MEMILRPAHQFEIDMPALDEKASNSNWPMEKSYNSLVHKICLLGPKNLVLPRAPDGLKAAFNLKVVHK